MQVELNEVGEADREQSELVAKIVSATKDCMPKGASFITLVFLPTGGLDFKAAIGTSLPPGLMEAMFFQVATAMALGAAHSAGRVTFPTEH